MPEGSAGRHGPGVNASEETSTSGGGGDTWKGAGPKHSLGQMLSLESGMVKVEQALQFTHSLPSFPGVSYRQLN